MEKTMRGALMCAVLATAALCFGQQAESKDKPDAEGKAAQAAGQTEAPQEERSFQLTFTVRELDENGKVVNSRKYVTMAATGPRANGGGGNIRTGAKIAVPNGANSSQFAYMDVGANFDVSRLRVIKSNHVAMQVSAEISSFDSPAPNGGMATIRQNRWTGEVQVPIGGRKVFFSADDLASKRSMQIELAVAPDAER